MTSNTSHTPSTSRRRLLFGIVLLVLGLILVGRYALEGANTPAEGNAPADAAWQAGTIIGAAVLTGVGALLVVTALLKRRVISRGRARAESATPSALRTGMDRDGRPTT